MKEMRDGQLTRERERERVFASTIDQLTRGKRRGKFQDSTSWQLVYCVWTEHTLIFDFCGHKAHANDH